jgi:hypothetical protein
MTDRYPDVLDAVRTFEQTMYLDTDTVFLSTDAEDVPRWLLCSGPLIWHEQCLVGLRLHMEGPKLPHCHC